MPRSNGGHRKGVLNYLIGAARIGLASVAAKSQVATNRRWLIQQALPRASMIVSLVGESRSALRHLRRGAASGMRAYLLATTAAAALLAATSAHAQDATWLLNPGSRTFNTATNWNPAVVPTNTAIFGASNSTLISFQPFTTTSIGTLQFNSDAPAYFFATSDGLFTSISVTGAGIVDNSANAPTFIVGNQANLSFRNASTAGDATIITNAGGITIFADSATGGNARLIANAGGVFDISSLSTGGNDGRLDRGRGNFPTGLETAHRRQQQSLDHGERCYCRHRRRLASQDRHRNTRAFRHQYLHGADDGGRRRASRERLDRAVEPDHGEQRRRALRQRHRGFDRRQCRRLPRSRQFPRHDDGRRRSHNSAQRFLRRAGEPADGFEDECERQRLAGRHRRGRLFPRHLSRAQLHNFDGR